jgi:acetoin utilization deacetylase AcuC-like enzyme
MAQGWPMNEPPFDEAGRFKRYFLPSTIDIGVHEHQQDCYLDMLDLGLKQLALQSPAKPDLAIVVQGSDPYEHDVLPSATLLKLSEKIMLERDRLVYKFLCDQKIPQAYVMAGGYGPHNHKVHANFIKDVLKTRTK